MEISDRKHALWLGRCFLGQVREWDYSLADEVIHGSIRPHTAGYRVAFEEPGFKVYEDREHPRNVLIIARAHGLHYAHRIDYGRKSEG